MTGLEKLGLFIAFTALLFKSPFPSNPVIAAGIFVAYVAGWWLLALGSGKGQGAGQNTEMIKLVRRLLVFFYQRQLGRKKVLPRWAVYDGRNWSWVSNELGEIVARLHEMLKPNQQQCSSCDIGHYCHIWRGREKSHEWRCKSCGTVNHGESPQKCKKCGRYSPAPWE